MSSLDVLVVGAGPTGLTLALQAHEHGATVRIVDRRSEAFRRSRAMIVHARTLECLRPLGVTAALLDRADRSPRAQLHVGSRVVDVGLGAAAMRGTAYPHLTMVRQADVEEILQDALRRRGVELEWGVELDALEVADERAQATLGTTRGREPTTSRYVVGCDGPASMVRNTAGIAWDGGSYRQEIVLADLELEADLMPDVLHVVAGRTGLLFLFALGEGATWRLLGTRPAGSADQPYGQPGQAVDAAEVQALIDDAGLEAQVREMPWSAQVRLQHRVARKFRYGPLFLAGDAAHTHSPAAAQGMNTGIIEAVNLGWKLAYADHARPALLDSYDRERRPAARQALALTHAVFFAEASTHPLPQFLRGRVLPLLAPLLPMMVRQPHAMAAVITLLSQPWVRYPGSALSVADGFLARGPRPGDRLPDRVVTCAGRQTRLHDLTASPGVHLLLARDAERAELDRLGPRVTVHRIDSWPGTGLTAVRPDGHVGYRSARSARALTDWLELVGAT
ncbi:FAD-dependent monooxygenase [Nocardioides sp. NPDC006303]|uniref:FAD-dependent monooxygenase n=1 Tax=Nocardioides sp. NPDC006303 TaxID=3156747 RepID=UPI0033B8904D